MKKRLIWVMVLSFLMFGVISGENVHASQGPAFLIEEDYVIINYERYELVDNKIFFDGLEYELIDNNFISYDEENVTNVLLMPVPENQITDKAVLARLNGQIHNDTKAIPSNIVATPYTKVVPAGEWNSQTPYLTMKGGYTILRLDSMPQANKVFSVHLGWCDIAGDWYTYPPINNYDFSVKNFIQFSKFSSAVCGQFILGDLYGTPGYKYTIYQTNS